MKNQLTRTLCLTGCLALLFPAVIPAAVVSATDTETETTTQSSAFPLITQDADLTGAVPDGIVSISKNTKPDNVIFNYGGLTITLVNYYNDGEHLYMYLDINNNTDKTYYISSDDVLVNGLSCSSGSSITAPAGQLSSDYIVMYTSDDLSRYLTMNSVSDVQFSLRIINYDAYMDYYDSDDYYSDMVFDQYVDTAPIRFKDYAVHTDALDSGKVLYNAGGLKIVKKDLFIRNYGPADLHLVLYLENTGSETIYIKNDSNIINNYSVDADLSGPLSPGECDIVHMTIPAAELKELNISKLSDLKRFEGTFSLFNGDDGYYGYYYDYDNATRVKTPMINFLK